MQIYLVGGAVRDALLGLPVADRDWVVVGADAAELMAMGMQPVGKDFPVFLHPDTHEEYALARTERKSGRGYHGFVFYAGKDVTLEDDLRRRDLTVNAMAQDETGALIDPFGGKADLAQGILRHVSEAFAEDPVRILRTARFAARFGFQVASETMVLMQQMVAAGEADELVAERVWQEISKGMMSDKPLRMLEILDEAGALARVWQAAKAGDWQRLAAAAEAKLGLPERYAALLARLPENEIIASNRCLNVPKRCADAALLASRWLAQLAKIVRAQDAAGAWALLHGVDGLRRTERLHSLLALALSCGVITLVEQQIWHEVVAAAVEIDAAAIAANTPVSERQAAIAKARIEAIAVYWANT